MSISFNLFGSDSCAGFDSVRCSIFCFRVPLQDVLGLGMFLARY